MSAHRRIELLDALRLVHIRAKGTSRYTFPDIPSLCRKVLEEDDSLARAGAQTVLNWLNGECELIIASQPDTTTDPQVLLRASQDAAPDVKTDTLLRGAGEPHKSKNSADEPHRRRTLRERLFGKRKSVNE